MDFYINCVQYGNKILLCGYENGKRYKKEISYCPYLFVPSRSVNKYKTIDGKSVEKKPFASIQKAKEFIRDFKEVDGMSIYGLDRFNYVYLHDHFKDLQYDTTLIRKVVLDIEVSTEDGNPDIELANKEITAITMMYDDVTFVFGYVDFVTEDPKTYYIKCKDESELLKKFLKLWTSDVYRPDVVTGWNIELFDIPYCVRRISKVLGYDHAKSISPWGILREHEFETYGKMQKVFTPLGVNILDYYVLYRKFTYTQQESYRLDYICEVELDENKLDYSEYGNLNELYKRNPQKYIEYNIHDCRLVQRLDDKMQLLNLVYEFAYDSGTNYDDALKAVRSWDVIIHNYLLDRGIVIPQIKKHENTSAPIGAHVKSPLVGLYDWVVSFDLTSLYPHLIIGYNISPDTFKGKSPKYFSVEDLLQEKSLDILEFLQEKNYTLAANCTLFTKETQGFLPKLMEELFEKRKLYKKQMLEYTQEYQKNPTVELKHLIAKMNNLQMAAKIKLNSAYGALANLGFRWYDKDYAEAITLSGQLTIRWAENKLNEYLNKSLGTSDVDYVIASDTDSVYINMAEVVKKMQTTDKMKIIENLDLICSTAIQKYLNKIYGRLANNMNCYKQAMHMKRESIAERGIFIAKKRYIINVWNNEGVQYEKPKLKMMGIEAVRSSTPSSCREAIKNGLNVILNEGETNAIEFIETFKKKFKTFSFEEISFPRGINNLDKYKNSATIYSKGTPIHVRGALLYNKLLTEKKLIGKYQPIVDKEKIRFCYLKLPNPIHENVIATSYVLPKEFGLDEFIDYDLMFEKAFLEPIKTILDAIGWKHKKEHTLEGLFS